MTLRPVAPRASLSALIAASVPELTRRTCSMLGTCARIASASSTSRSVGAPKESPSSTAACTAGCTAGWRWPRIIGAGRDVVARLAVFLALAGERPEEAVGNDVAHAGTKAGVERLVEEGERLADGGVELDAGREQRGERGRERLAGADEGGLEALE